MVGFQYICVRLVGRLVFSSRGGVSSWASCCGILSSRLVFVLASCSWRMRGRCHSWGVSCRWYLGMGVSCPCVFAYRVSRRWRLVSVSPLRVSFRQSSRPHSVPSCSCRYRGGRRGGSVRGWNVFAIMWLWRRCSISVCRLARWVDRNVPFYSARFLIFAFTRSGLCSWRDGIDMGRISVVVNGKWQECNGDGGSNDGGRDEIRDDIDEMNE